ncbi:hypothetical protein IMPJCBKJ_00985 [Pseudoalteromonas sp. MB47]|jgi:hypothetical protein|nr:hypothetical protein [Pseudoalteromonas sp. MB47]|tara:strand:+ start:259 stop:477 length:219 start_codon:yes stop_codon:yes gene_type:complete
MFDITLDDIRSKLNDKNNKLHALIAAKRSNVSWLIKNAPSPSASNVKFKSQSSSFSMVVSDRVCVEKGAPLW